MGSEVGPPALLTLNDWTSTVCCSSDREMLTKVSEVVWTVWSFSWISYWLALSRGDQLSCIVSLSRRCISRSVTVVAVAIMEGGGQVLGHCSGKLLTHSSLSRLGPHFHWTFTDRPMH